MANKEPKKFDLAKALEGTDFGGVDDFASIEGLIPSYNPEVALAEGWDPVVGRLDRIIRLPEQLSGTKDAYTPLALQIILAKPNKAVVGNRQNRREVARKVGDAILVFVSGNLGTKRELLAAATDPEVVYPIVLAVTGTEYVNKKGNPMWIWETHLGDKTIPREGTYRLFSSDIPLLDVQGILAEGKEEAKLAQAQA